MAVKTMTRRTTSRVRRRPRERDDATTREKLLEAAGQVFAEMGFDRATGKEICERAGANAAAVNYYFGGMDGLYEAVFREARSRMVTLKALTAAVAGKADAKAKLEAVIELLVEALTAPLSSSWVLRVIAREIVAPSPAVDALREKEMIPKSRIMKAIVAELMGLPEDHAAVARGCVSVMGPYFMLFVCDRRTLKSLFPQFSLAPENTTDLIRHMVQFAVAGLKALADDARDDAQSK